MDECNVFRPGRGLPQDICENCGDHRRDHMTTQQFLRREEEARLRVEHEKRRFRPPSPIAVAVAVTEPALEPTAEEVSQVLDSIVEGEDNAN